MTERAVTFGPRNELVGILSTPDTEPDPSRPAVLMWNVGVNHRVGPFRSHVELARKLTAEGFISLRFDASGLGDSDVRREAVRDVDREPLDVGDAMNFVTERTGVDRFVVFGYCSSVDAAHRVALDDGRVVGAVHIESFAHTTKQSRRRARRRNLTNLVRWDRTVRRRIVKISRAFDKVSESDDGQPVYTRYSPTPEQFRIDLARLTTELRKPHLIAYGAQSAVNHVDQFWEMFDHPGIDRALVDVHYFEGADHTFYDLGHREAMISAVTEWAASTFPNGANTNDPVAPASATH